MKPNHRRKKNKDRDRAAATKRLHWELGLGNDSGRGHRGMAYRIKGAKKGRRVKDRNKSKKELANIIKNNI